jgi:inner membrane protein
VEAEARRQLAAAGQETAVVRAYPTILQPYYRRVVARLDGKVLVGFHSVLNPGPIAWSAATPAPEGAVAGVADTPEAGVLRWFADGQVLWQAGPDGGLIEARDLRYGYPEPGVEFGLWGLRAVGGGTPQVFKERPTITGERLARLWRLVFG